MTGRDVLYMLAALAALLLAIAAPPATKALVVTGHATLLSMVEVPILKTASTSRCAASNPSTGSGGPFSRVAPATRRTEGRHARRDDL